MRAEGRGRVRGRLRWLAIIVVLALTGCSDPEAADGEADAPDHGAVSPGLPVTPADAANEAGEVPPDTAAPPPLPAGTSFIEDFTDAGALDRFDFHLFHRDDSVVAEASWAADHEMTGPDDLCGPPDNTRVVDRGSRAEGFNDDWIYRCIPGGDLAKAHIMTSIGDTSGYSIGSFSPRLTFNGLHEVRWDVNQTDLGDRQWTEVSIIPVERYDPDRLPCTSDVPCDTISHAEAESVGIQWAGQRTRRINTWQMPDGYMEATGSLGYRCDGCDYAPARRFGEAYGSNDPALTSVQIRRENYFRDNRDGTLTWGFQLDNGSFEEFTVPGSFPPGPVRVVFKDHNYTPLKSPATLLADTTFTWHWDNIAVHTTAAGTGS